MFGEGANSGEPKCKELHEMTGLSRDWMEEETLRPGASAYLRKPFDEQCLFDAIRSASGRAV